MRDKKNKKYKLIAETRNATFVYRRDNSKEKLEEIALKISILKPRWKFIVVSSSFHI